MTARTSGKTGWKGFARPVSFEDEGEAWMVGRADTAIVSMWGVEVGAVSWNAHQAAARMRSYRYVRLVILNRDPTDLDSAADLVLNHEIGPTLTAVCA